jgi:uncharacterized membrane protein
MGELSRLSAAAAYVPMVGWLYVVLFQRQNPLVMYHLRQSIGLCLFLLFSLLGWAVVAWFLAWLPYLSALSVGLFTIVMVAYLFGAVAWLLGVINALRQKASPLPGFGRWAERLPIR